MWRKHSLAIIAAVALVSLTLGPISAVLLRAGGLAALGPADFQALRFTLWQAFLSAALSTALAIPVARALARRSFPGRGVLVALLGAPFILPTIVAIMGLIAIFGQRGIVNAGLSAIGLPSMDIYGLHGVLLAHVFFNLPLATRMVLQGWLAIPAERFRLSATLGLSPWAMFRIIEWPLIRRIAPGAFAVIFVICLTSFAVALTLGGGPRATTVELAIYQAMRFDFDLGHAAALALLQLGLAILAGLIALRVSHIDGFGTGRDRLVPRWDGRGWVARLGDGLWLLAASAFLLGPLSAMLIKGLPGLLELQSDTYRAALNSSTVALASTALCMIWAMPLANRRGELLSLASIALSPLVLGTGIFLMLRPFVNPFTMALPVTTLVNALMALPFALRILRPAAEEVDRDYARLRQTLRLSPLAWLRLIWLPRLRRPMGFAAGLTAALAMGDLGVIALFADPDRATLPLQVYRLMGAYRLEAAAGAALLLMLLSLSMFWLFDKGGRVNADP